MPRIVGNFLFDSQEPNFERDRFDTYNDMNNVDSRYIDVGHISYCVETDTHYKYEGTETDDEGNVVNKWTELVNIDELDLNDLLECLEILSYDDSDSDSDYYGY